MEETALKKSSATKYTVYFPFNKEDQDAISEIKKRILVFVRKVFRGATIYNAQGIYTSEEGIAKKQEQEDGRQKNEGRQFTYVLEILAEDVEDKEVRIEQLAWLILCYLDDMNLSKNLSKNRGHEETVWFYEQPVTLYKLYNPDITKSSTS
jgi:hypothetical protein